MSTSISLPQRTALGLCPYCGQSLDQDAQEHLDAAIEQQEKSRAAGFAVHLVKPIDARKLLDVLADLPRATT